MESPESAPLRKTGDRELSHNLSRHASWGYLSSTPKKDPMLDVYVESDCKLRHLPQCPVDELPMSSISG